MFTLDIHRAFVAFRLNRRFPRRYTLRPVVICTRQETVEKTLGEHIHCRPTLCRLRGLPSRRTRSLTLTVIRPPLEGSRAEAIVPIAKAQGVDDWTKVVSSYGSMSESEGVAGAAFVLLPNNASRSIGTMSHPTPYLTL